MRITLALGLAAWITPLAAQPDLRSQEIEAARDQKEQQLESETQPRFERDFVRVQRWTSLLFGDTNGFHLRLGGMAPGSGLALGPEYTRKDLWDSRLLLRLNAAASTRGWYRSQFQAGLPELWNGRAFVDFSTTHRDYGSMAYYGPGPDSRKSGRSDYRLEDTLVELRPGIRPMRRLTAGVTGGFLAVNVGPGASSTFISTDRQFGPDATPGITRQSSFWRSGAFVQYDWRDHPSDTTSGGKYVAEYLVFSDRQLGRFSFNRLDLDVQQYIPFLNHKRVIALRGRSSLAAPHQGQQVPFYLQPTLGGPDTLRGFGAFRYYDDKMVALNAEYRWEASRISRRVTVSARQSPTTLNGRRSTTSEASGASFREFADSSLLTRCARLPTRGTWRSPSRPTIRLT